MKKFLHAVGENDPLHLLFNCVEASATGMTIADMRQDGAPLIYVNPAFEHMTGYRREEVLGKNCRFLQGPDKNQIAAKAIKKSIQLGQSTTQLLRNYHKDGRFFWNSLQVSPIRDERGQVTHYVGIQSDVTSDILNQEAKFQQEYDKISSEYERKMTQISHLSSLGEMSSFIIHEINSPLSVIVGRLHLLEIHNARSSNFDPKLQASLEEIRKGANKIAAITKNFKRLSYQGDSSGENSHFSLSKVIDDVVPLWSEKLRKSGILFKITGDIHSMIYGDENLLSQVFLNLLSNASYAAEKHPNPFVGFDVSEEEDWVTIKIQNSSSPLSEDIKARLFKGYYSSKPKGEGTGFGLMICKKIIESMNGLISLSPRTDLVEFVISLPKYKKENSPSDKEKRSGAA